MSYGFLQSVVSVSDQCRAASLVDLRSGETMVEHALQRDWLVPLKRHVQHALDVIPEGAFLEQTVGLLADGDARRTFAEPDSIVTFSEAWVLLGALNGSLGLFALASPNADLAALLTQARSALGASAPWTVLPARAAWSS